MVFNAIIVNMNQKSRNSHENSNSFDRLKSNALRTFLGILVVGGVFGYKLSQDSNNQTPTEQTRLATITFNSGAGYDESAKELAIADGIDPSNPTSTSYLYNQAALLASANGNAELTPQTVLRDFPVTVDSAHSRTASLSGDGINIIFNTAK